jgi:hypothetical protein
LIVDLSNLPASTARCGELFLGVRELLIRISEEDQPQDGDRILRRFQLGVCPEFVGGFPKAFFHFCVVGWHRLFIFAVTY